MSMLAISCVANGNKKCYANKHNHNILYIKLKGTDIEYCNCCIKDSRHLSENCWTKLN